MRKIFLVLAAVSMLLFLNSQAIKAEDTSKEQTKTSEKAECLKKFKKAGHEKIFMHTKMHKNLKDLAEMVGGLNEVKNNPELKQKIDTIIKEIEDMESKCSSMLRKHKERKEHKEEHKMMHH